ILRIGKVASVANACGTVVDPRKAAGYGSRGGVRRRAHATSRGPQPGRGKPWWRLQMTTFDDREKAFEKKVGLDKDLKFRAEARRNKLLAEWAAAKLGIMGAALSDYVRAILKADLLEKGDDDVFRKIRKDFDEADVAVSDTEIRSRMSELLAKA